MKILSFHAPDGVRLGIETDAGVVDVRAAAAAAGLPAPATMQELIAGGAESSDQLKHVLGTAKETVPAAEISFAPPINDPNKIICVGANYRKHAAEAGLPLPSRPIYFSKFRNSLAGHQESVAVPSATEQVDYEVELVAVIGQPTRNVGVTEALDYVFGYATGNDLSARELQMRTTQWLYGKAIDGFAPLGPYIVTADEVADPQNLNLKCWVNGEQRQNSNTKDMVFSVAEMISDLSQIMTLEPGDLIYTGTPEGVILGMQEKIWLKPGDEISCEVEGLGVLTNALVGERVLQ
ncbi:fumarylacetoacetate hydrolase family protein [Arthrobacter sp. H14]|uniref:fumarylacetoacetate hydrolase family protein n=1 Tax=Arthrobacter sp. H14 TaxID=1312959 RepID=UPI00047A419E|nr:fumarylacetoacetate hydrolase family protein [Arthrobacter sp. H14]